MLNLFKGHRNTQERSLKYADRQGNGFKGVLE